VGASGRGGWQCSSGQELATRNHGEYPLDFEWRGLAGNIQIIQISINQIAPSADRWLILLNKLPASFPSQKMHRYLSD
jgi:hypothetical protein